MTLQVGTIVTRRDDIKTRYIVVRPPNANATAVLQRVDWDLDRAQWRNLTGSIPFYAPTKWELAAPWKSELPS